MTTKEFIRRSDYFNNLDSVVPELLSSNLCYCYCYKITCVTSNSTQVVYTFDAHFYIKERPGFFVRFSSVYIEKYTKEQFVIDFRFFKSFVARLSKYQFDSLKASGKCSHLLAYLSNNKSFV